MRHFIQTRLCQQYCIIASRYFYTRRLFNVFFKISVITVDHFLLPHKVLPCKTMEKCKHISMMNMKSSFVPWNSLCCLSLMTTSASCLCDNVTNAAWQLSWTLMAWFTDIKCCVYYVVVSKLHHSYMYSCSLHSLIFHSWDSKQKRFFIFWAQFLKISLYAVDLVKYEV